MRPAVPLPRPRHLLGLSAFVAAASGVAAATTSWADAVAVAVGAVLAGTLVPFAVGITLVLREIREQQRQIIDQLETQSRLLYHAAQLAGELTDD